MSATNRGAVRSFRDYYVTPTDEIRKFLHAFAEVVGTATLAQAIILDPCAGGDAEKRMSYPDALSSWSPGMIYTLDIRDDSRSLWRGDYLTWDALAWISPPPTIIISNPPFSDAREFVIKALQDVRKGGWVVMLLRLSFFGTQDRATWLKDNMPKYAFVHAKRMSFGKNAKGVVGTDASEYAHFCWRKGENPAHTEFRIV